MSKMLYPVTTFKIGMLILSIFFLILFWLFDYKDFFEKSAEIEKADIATLACSGERRTLYKYNNADELIRYIFERFPY